MAASQREAALAAALRANLKRRKAAGRASGGAAPQGETPPEPQGEQACDARPDDPKPT